MPTQQTEVIRRALKAYSENLKKHYGDLFTTGGILVDAIGHEYRTTVEMLTEWKAGESMPSEWQEE